jgi:hypothetical protein
MVASVSASTLSLSSGSVLDGLPQVVGVPGEQVLPGDGAGRGGTRPDPFGQILDVFQARLDAHRLGPRAAQFNATVLRRVVAGRDHRAGHAEVTAGVVQHVGRAQAAGHHVGPLRRHPAAEGIGQRA